MSAVGLTTVVLLVGLSAGDGPPKEVTSKEAPAPTENQRAQARKLRDRAFARLADDDFAAGIEHLSSAHALVPNPGLLLNIAIAYRRWGGHCDDAFTALARFEASCGRDCEFAEAGRREREALDGACLGVLRLVAAPPALVFVDGRIAGRTPTEQRLRAGVYEVRTSSSAPFSVEVTAGSRQTLLLTDVSAPPSPPRDLRARTAWTYALAGLAAGGVVVGATFTGLAVDTASSVDAAAEAGGSPEEVRALDAQQEREAATAVVGWTVAAASGAAALFLHLSRPTDDRRPDRVAVEVGVGSLAVRF